MTLRATQEYIARDANNIVSIEGNKFLFPPKKSHPIFYYYSQRALCVILLSLNTIVSDCRLPFCLFTNRALFRSHIIAGQ